MTPKDPSDTEQRAARADWPPAESLDPNSGSAVPVTWRNDAACLDGEPELFFPIGNANPALVQAEVAKAVCHRCEVAVTCLTWAIESGQDSGVWGGLSEDERRALKRRNTRARHAV